MDEVITHLTADLREDEGEILHAYLDHLGFWTIGVGVLIDERRGGGITADESAYLLANRISSKSAELAARLPWFAGLDQVRKCALLNMAYQLGVDGLLKFRASLTLMRIGQYKAAGEELKNSKWFQQTPARARRVIESIQTGKYRP